MGNVDYMDFEGFSNEFFPGPSIPRYSDSLPANSLQIPQGYASLFFRPRES